MSNILSDFIFQIIGAIICWVFIGFKGRFSDQMSGPYERNPKRFRNVIVSVIAVLIIVYIFKK